MKKAVLRTAAAFLISVTAAMAFLLLGALIPQGRIDENVRQSAEMMREEGVYPRMADRSDASMLDNWTDALILSQSKAMTASRLETILTNPLFEQSGDNPVEDLYRYANGEDPQPTGSYARYWMGFRTPVRLALSFLNYYQLRRYTAAAFFVLLFAAVCSVAGRLGPKTAFLFSLCMVLVRPHIIAMGLQLSCCFLIAFPAMLWMPRLADRPENRGLFFLELGIATMFFDFYTTPIITLLFPLVYLYLLCRRQGKPVSGREAAVLVGLWFGGYCAMWLAKLLLTTAFTDVNGFENGFTSFLYRIGVRKTQGMEFLYSPIQAIRNVWFALYCDKRGEVIWLLALAAGAAALFFRIRRMPGGIRSVWRQRTLLVLGLLPVLWFVAAAQPTANHYWFQYRSVAATAWAWGACLLPEGETFPRSEE